MHEWLAVNMPKTTALFATKDEMEAARCRIHLERKAEVWLYGRNTQVCYQCHDEYAREFPRGPGSRDVVLGWIQSKTAVLCPGCAHEAAILEDAQRELEEFLHIVDNTVRVGFE